MRIFKNRYFHKWAKAEGLKDTVLRKAVDELEGGLETVSLGSGLYKKRVMRQGQGKRGAYRTLIAFRRGDRTFFVYGFTKNEQDNINTKELEIYKKLAKYYLGVDEVGLDKLLNNDELIEV